LTVIRCVPTVSAIPTGRGPDAGRPRWTLDGQRPGAAPRSRRRRRDGGPRHRRHRHNDRSVTHTNADANTLVDDPGSATAAATQLTTATGGTDQQWSVTGNSDGSFSLTNAASGLCRDNESSGSAGAAIKQEACSTTATNQRWYLTPVPGGYKLGSAKNKIPLTAGPSSGSKLTQSDDTNQPGQVFTVAVIS
jgi:hypothetical protein